MEENTTKKELSLMAWIGILIALLLGVICIFAMLEMVIPKVEVPPVQQVEVVDEIKAEQPVPKFCPDCGAGLPESFAWGKFCPFCGELVEWEQGT